MSDPTFQCVTQTQIDLKVIQAQLDEIVRNRTQGAKDGWQIRRRKERRR